MKKWVTGLNTLLGLVAVAALTVLLVILFSQSTNGPSGEADLGQSQSPIETPTSTETRSSSTPTIPSGFELVTTTPGHLVYRELVTPWPTRTPWPTPTQDPRPTATAIPQRELASSPRGMILYRSYPMMDDQGRPIQQITTPIGAVEIDERGESIGQVSMGWDQVNRRMYFSRLLPSPDGRYLAGTMSSESGESVFIVDIETGEFTLPEPGYTEVPGLMYGWHPNGGQIVLRTIGGKESGLWLVNIHTGKHQLVAQPKPPNGISGAAISPDGRWLAYGFTPGAASTPSQYEGIWLAESNGRNASKVAPYGGYVFSWSPDGKYFIYIGGRKEDHTPSERPAGTSGKGPLFSVMNIQTGEHRSLPISFTFGYGHYPEWSPDSRSIAYVGYDDVSEQAPISRDDPTHIFQGVGIYVVDIESAQVRHLGSGIDPAWSPDGSAIVFSAIKDDQVDLWLINADGSNLRQLTDTPEIDWRPVWIKR